MDNGATNTDPNSPTIPEATSDKNKRKVNKDDPNNSLLAPQEEQPTPSIILSPARQKKEVGGLGEGGEGNKTPRPEIPGARKHGAPETTEAHKRRKRKKGIRKERTQQQPKTGQPKPGRGRANKERTETSKRKR